LKEKLEKDIADINDFIEKCLKTNDIIIQTSIPDKMRKLVTKIVIPNNVTYIDNYAFYDCISLESITIPDSVTGIGAEAFFGC
jgi:hypothetical protein